VLLFIAEGGGFIGFIEGTAPRTGLFIPNPIPIVWFDFKAPGLLLARLFMLF
jgi:hypothetical protein